jgi:ABC-type Fe3+ transport system permease subunit
LSRIIAFVLLLSWYYTSGRPQVAFIKSRFGKAYPKRGWAKPLLLAVAALVGFLVVVVAFAAVGAMFTHEV